MELEDEERRREHFSLFVFKVEPCCNRAKHPWDACPYSHPKENARRRDVRQYRYLAEACPDYKLHGFCALGNECPFAHGVFEINLHPSKYRTQMCVEGCKCTRKMCFFAHNEAQLRQADHTYGYRNTAEAEYVKERLLARFSSPNVHARTAGVPVAPGTPPQAPPPSLFGARGRPANPCALPANPAALMSMEASLPFGFTGSQGWSATAQLSGTTASPVDPATERYLRSQQGRSMPLDGGPRISMKVRRELGLEPPAKPRAQGANGVHSGLCSPVRKGGRHHGASNLHSPLSPSSSAALGGFGSTAHLGRAALLQHTAVQSFLHGLHGQSVGFPVGSSAASVASLEEALARISHAPEIATPPASELGFLPPMLRGLRNGLLDTSSESERDAASVLSSPDAATAFARRSLDGLALQLAPSHCEASVPGLAALGLSPVDSLLCL